MIIENAKYIDSTGMTISATVNGVVTSISVREGNRHFDEIIKKAIFIAPYIAPSSVFFVSFDDFEGRFSTVEWDDATDFVYEVDVVTGKPKRRALVQGIARAQARNNVDLLDNKTVSFLQTLVLGGIITVGRKTEILTP